jgi:threonine/homoserine/homoserine lactone efflux protein
LVLGHGLLELAMVAGLVGGLGHFLEKSLVAGIIGLGGGLFLLWMGYSIIRSTGRNSVSFNDEPSPTIARGNPVLAGILVSVSNPYWLVWWAAVGSSYVVWAMRVGIVGLVAFYSGHILSDLAWYSLVSLLVASGRRIVKDKVYQGLLLVCGLFLLGLGGYFVFSGIEFLR